MVWNLNVWLTGSMSLDKITPSLLALEPFIVQEHILTYTVAMTIRDNNSIEALPNAESRHLCHCLWAVSFIQSYNGP